MCLARPGGWTTRPVARGDVLGFGFRIFGRTSVYDSVLVCAGVFWVQGVWFRGRWSQLGVIVLSKAKHS